MFPDHKNAIRHRRFSQADDTANRIRFPQPESALTQFMLPYAPIEYPTKEYPTKDGRDKFGTLSYVADAKFFINVHNNHEYLTFEYEFELDERHGSQYLMVHSFYVEATGRTYRFYFETPGDEHYQLYILELTYLPLVYMMDTQSRAYMIEFAKHNMEHGNNALN